MNTSIDHLGTPAGGRIGLVRCPGTRLAGLLGGGQRRCDGDLARLAHWGAQALVTLLEPPELYLLGVDDLGERAGRHGLEWWHLPIADGTAPTPRFEEAWREAGPALHARLDAGGRIVVHCRAGLGRSGAIAARLLVERGLDPARAISAVRRARPGAIESPEQARWVHHCAPR